MKRIIKSLLKTVVLPLAMVMVVSTTEYKVSIYEESIAVCSELPPSEYIQNNN